MNRFSLIISICCCLFTAQAEVLQVAVLPGECWWGGATDLGPDMPFANSEQAYDLQHYNFNNQTAPLLLSNKGRYIWADGPIVFSLNNDTISIDTPRGGEIQLTEAGANLRDAYLHACQHHFAPAGTIPPELFFDQPTYNTWIELLYDQNQADVLRYAHAIVDNGFTPGIIMIDDNWQKDYGEWEFRPDRFPDPKKMVDELHAMGFKVMLWVCPFVSPDNKEARDIHALGYLLRDKHNADEAAVVRWWNGYSHVYDLSNPDAYAYLKSRFASLQERYGIDGFKMDGGDPCYYPVHAATAHDKQALDVDQTRLWAQLASEFDYNELRACWAQGCQPLVQRLGDKKYSWPGVSRLVPAMIQAALLGHSYACPDMIGGGEYGSFYGVKAEDFDQTMFVRSCQIHSMMPIMQFSVAPWRILSPENLEICRYYSDLHHKMAPYIIEQAKNTAATGEPIVRAMSFSFPDEGFDSVIDQYMLGDKYLIAPITTAENHRSVKLPKGRWRDDTGKTWRGGRTIEIDVPLQRLPIFEKL